MHWKMIEEWLSWVWLTLKKVWNYSKTLYFFNLSSTWIKLINVDFNRKRKTLPEKWTTFCSPTFTSLKQSFELLLIETDFWQSKPHKSREPCFKQHDILCNVIWCQHAWYKHIAILGLTVLQKWCLRLYFEAVRKQKAVFCLLKQSFAFSGF